MDLSAYSYSDLRQLAQQLETELKRKQIQEVEKARDAIAAIAKGLGMTVEALMKTAVDVVKSQRAPRAPLEARYVNPDNSEETWTGVGRAPKWVRRHLEAGGLKEALQIQKAK